MDTHGRTSFQHHTKKHCFLRALLSDQQGGHILKKKCIEGNSVYLEANIADEIDRVHSAARAVRPEQDFPANVVATWRTEPTPPPPVLPPPSEINHWRKWKLQQRRHQEVPRNMKDIEDELSFRWRERSFRIFKPHAMFHLSSLIMPSIPEGAISRSTRSSAKPGGQRSAATCSPSRTLQIQEQTEVDERTTAHSVDIPFFLSRKILSR